MATNTWTGGGLVPSRDPHEAYTDAVILAPGTYLEGQAIGEYTTRTAASEVQRIQFSTAPTTFRLTLGGQVTGVVTWSATPATMQANIQAALDALPNVGVGNSVVVGSGAGLINDVTFAGALGNQNLPLMILSSLVGAGAAGTVTETTAGAPPGATYGPYDDTLANGVNICRAFLQYAGIVDEQGNHNFGGLGYNTGTSRTAPAWFTGTFYTAKPDGTLALPGLDANGCDDVGRMIRGVKTALTAIGSELRMT